MTPNAKRGIFFKFFLFLFFLRLFLNVRVVKNWYSDWQAVTARCFSQCRFGVIELGLFVCRLKDIFRIVLERARLSTWWFVLVRDTVSQLVVKIKSSQPVSVFNALAFLICVTGLLLYLNKDTVHYHFILSTRLALVSVNQSINQSTS